MIGLPHLSRVGVDSLPTGCARFVATCAMSAQYVVTVTCKTMRSEAVSIDWDQSLWFFSLLAPPLSPCFPTLLSSPFHSQRIVLLSSCSAALPFFSLFSSFFSTSSPFDCQHRPWPAAGTGDVGRIFIGVGGACGGCSSTRNPELSCSGPH